MDSTGKGSAPEIHRGGRRRAAWGTWRGGRRRRDARTAAGAPRSTAGRSETAPPPRPCRSASRLRGRSLRLPETASLSWFRFDTLDHNGYETILSITRLHQKLVGPRVAINNWSLLQPFWVGLRARGFWTEGSRPQLGVTTPFGGQELSVWSAETRWEPVFCLREVFQKAK